MSDHEHKAFKFELKEIDVETGVFEGYGSTFAGAPDSYGDVVDKGAFTKTIQEGAKRIKILWNHQTLEPIGKPVELKEDEKGLYIKGKLSLGVQRAREVLSLMKDGVVNELSIGYDTITEVMENGIRHLKEIKLWDVSPVTFAANPEATVTSVKSKKPLYIARNALDEALINDEDNESLTGVRDAIDALLRKGKAQETVKTDPAAKLPKEAALDMALAELVSTARGFDAKQAERRIESLLKKLQEVK